MWGRFLEMCTHPDWQYLWAVDDHVERETTVNCFGFMLHPVSSPDSCSMKDVTVMSNQHTVCVWGGHLAKHTWSCSFSYFFFHLYIYLHVYVLFGPLSHSLIPLSPYSPDLIPPHPQSVILLFLLQCLMRRFPNSWYPTWKHPVRICK
jgi:hypothetical protein